VSRMDHADSTLEEWEVLDLLTSLVDKSLVIYEEDEHGVGRYRLLETVRQYARDYLVASGESMARRDRHRDWFAIYAEQTAITFQAADTKWEPVELEFPNLRAALEWAMTGEGGLEASGRLWTVLFWFYNLRGRASEGREVYAQFLARHKTSQPTATTVGMMLAAGDLATRQHDYAVSRSIFEEVLRLSQEIGDASSAVAALNYLGNTALKQGDLASAKAHYEQSVGVQLENQPQSDARHNMLYALLGLGHIARFEQRFEQARHYYEKAAATVQEREPSHRLLVALLDMNLGHVARLTGNVLLARRYYGASLSLFAGAGHKTQIAYNLEGLACLAASTRDYQRAASLFGAAYALRQALQTPAPSVDRASYADSLQSTRSALGDEAFEKVWGQGCAMTLDQAVEHALDDGAEP